jgi:phage tail tape-measure protein
MRFAPTLLAVAALSLLAACGHREPERAEGGAATGAATGAAVGALAGPPGIVAGALIGGASGGATGAATSPNAVNLGAPPWHDNSHAGQEAARDMNH